MKFNNRNVVISENAKIGKNVKIGDNTTIYENVEIGDNSIICNDVILGEPTYEYYANVEYKNKPLIIGANSLIRSHSIFYAGSRFGEFLVTGHRITVREHTIAGNHCSFGSYSDIQGDCTFGNYVRLHSYVNVGQKSRVGNFVFIYPFVVLTNDPTPPSTHLIGSTIGDFTQVTTGSIILSGSEIGIHCLIGANSTVGGSFVDYSFINGSPASTICDIRKAPLFNLETASRHYPWPKHFDRGMPWKGLGFEKWQSFIESKLGNQ